MKKLSKSILGLALAALIVVPTSVFATGDEDEGMDYDYCQNAGPDAETYTLHFETDGGTVIPDVKVTMGCSLYEMNQVPGDPEKDEHTFLGWFKDQAFRDSFNPHEVLDREETIYAKLIPNENVINQVTLNADAPLEGVEVTVEYDTSGGAAVEIQEPNPVVNTDQGDDERYWVSYTAWVTKNGSDDRFEGTFKAGQEYWIATFVDAREGYAFSPNLTATLNGKPANVRIEGNTNDWAIIYAKAEAVEGEEYTLEDEVGNSISFTGEEGHEYHFNVNQFSFSMTDEQLAMIPISREEYEAGKSIISDAVKDQGSVIAYFEIEVFEIPMCVENADDEPSPCMCVIENEDGEEEEVPCQDYLENGPFEIKIKYTDEMAGFDSYKLVYIRMSDEDGITDIEEAVELTLVDGYLVGTIPHLSGYALVGSIGAPNTGVVTNNHDSLTASIVSATIVASVVVASGFYVAKKHQQTTTK